jgi:shikimate dehydrogenase
VGAVNTLFFQEGKLVGENTDVPGFTADLQRFLTALPVKDAHALVLGAGGSARAVVCALGGAGWQVRVAAHRLEQCQEVVGRFSELGYAVQAVSLSLPNLGETLAENPIQLVVNTTPLGMGRLADASPWIDGLAFPQNCLVYDLVYNPAETVLMRQARAAGLRAANGWGMLLEQAALSFACWTGIPLDAGTLRRAFEEISFDPTD